MPIPNFEKQRPLLTEEFTVFSPVTDCNALSADALQDRIFEIERTVSSKALAKAKTFELILKHAYVSPDIHDIFQDKILGYKLMSNQRKRWEQAVKETYLSEESAKIRRAWKEYGAYHAIGDYGHVSPNTRLLLSVGFKGLIERVEAAAQQTGRSDHQKEFYRSCLIVLHAMTDAANRLADAIAPYNQENADVLRAIARNAPKNSYEAMQLIIFYFFMHEYIGATRVRTLGRLDVLLFPFYQADLKNGTYTKSELKEMLKFFLHKFWIAKVPFDLPFCLGGMDENGEDVTNEMSYLIVEAYNEMDIHSPKIHVRVSPKTPKDFILSVLSCIRGGNSSFVFVNDTVAVEALMRVGITQAEARDFVPIGCYEPAVWGVEMGCTGNGAINLPKAIELVLLNGKAAGSSEMVGVSTPMPKTYEEFLLAVKAQIAHMADEALRYVVAIEHHYAEINPDPLLSAQYEHSVSTGVDVYEGGAKYNNSSMYVYSIASLVDSICAVKRLVFEEKRFTLEQLRDILLADYEGYEKERRIALRLPEKYGNNHPLADGLTRDFAKFSADLITNRPNGRGGVFKAAIFTIDNCFYTGKRSMATPDGRKAGEPFSKNLCAVVGMDRNGITSLINSVTQIDFASFPTGSVLDILLHPSSVMGEDGLLAFYGILQTYFQKGGFAMHGNIFDAETLKLAQQFPERYQNLQVRVCGWNAYFVNLSKEEQDAFIRQAENTLHI
jgi:formate C-acetyltransferase